MKTKCFCYYLLFICVCFVTSKSDGQTNLVLAATNITELSAEDQEAGRLIPILKEYYLSHQFGKAEKLCLHILELAPDDAQSWEYLGIIYVTEHNYEKAIPVLQKAFGMGRSSALHWIYIAYREAKNPKAIHGLIPAILENKSKDPFLVDDLAEYAINNVLPDSRLLFYQAVDALSDDQIIQAHRRLVPMLIIGFEGFGDKNRADRLRYGLSKVKRAEEEKAVDIAQKLTPDECQKVLDQYEHDPAKAKIDHDLLTIAICYFKKMQFEKAKAVYNIIALVNTNDVHVFTGLGNCYLFQTNYEEAIKQYRMALAFGDSNVVQRLAVAYIGSTNQNVDRMKDLLPILMENKSKNLLFILGFALNSKPPDGRLFMNAIDGISDVELLENESVAKLAISGFGQFGLKDRAKTLMAGLKARSSGQ